MYGADNWYAHQRNMLLQQERMQRHMAIQAEREQHRMLMQQEQMFRNMAREAERQQRDAERVAIQQQKEYERVLKQQQMGNTGQYQNGVPATVKSIVDYISASLGTSDVTRVDEFETQCARHICPGERVIRLIQKNTFGIPTVNGMVYAEIIYCGNCGKLLINKNSISVL